MDTSLNDTIEDESLACISYPSNCSIYFIIDGSQQMFEQNPTSHKTYLEESLKAYRDIVVDKCLWNIEDYIGLMIFGVEQTNNDSHLENIYIFSELQTANMNMAKEINDLLKQDINIFSADKKYPLIDAMRHATKKSTDLKKNLAFKKIILCTSNDNPFPGNNSEKHEIRLTAKSMKEMSLQFEVVGVNENWNPDIFWKDIGIIFNLQDGTEYSNISLSDMKLNIQKPARTLRNTELHLGKDVKCPVKVCNIIKSTKYLEKYLVNAKTNLPVERKIQYVDKNDEFVDNDFDFDCDFYDNTRYEVQFGKRTAVFTGDEKKNIRTMPKEEEINGIYVIGFKHISINPEIHITTPFFVTWSKNSTKVEKELFTALLNQCHAKDVMAISTARMMSDPKIYSLIPSLEKGGFYLYEIPYKDQVRTEPVDTNEEEDSENEDENCTKLITKMIQRTQMRVEELSFNDPKLSKQKAHIQALVLDEEYPELKQDNTEPDIKSMREKFGNLCDIYARMFPQQAVHKGQKRTLADMTVNEKEDVRAHLDLLIKNNKINSCTAVQLRDFAKLLNLTTSGKKVDLLNRIMEKYRQ